MAVKTTSSPSPSKIVSRCSSMVRPRCIAMPRQKLAGVERHDPVRATSRQDAEAKADEDELGDGKKHHTRSLSQSA